MAKFACALVLFAAVLVAAEASSANLRLVSEGNGDLSLVFDSSKTLAGYQFAFTKLPEGATIVGSTGSDAQALPLTYNDGSHIGLGFSMSGANIPPRGSEGELVHFKVDRSGLYCLNKVILSDATARTIDFNFDDNCVKVTV